MFQQTAQNPESDKQFADRMTIEFVKGSGVDPSFLPLFPIVSDTEVDECGNLCEPIADALNWNTRRKQAGFSRRETFHAVFFENENGSLWQAKLSRTFKCGQKPYFAPKGCGAQVYLPPIPAGIFERIANRNKLEANAGALEASTKSTSEQSASPSVEVVPNSMTLPTDGNVTPSFWDYAKVSLMPVVWTEGGKKSLSLLSRGFLGVALYGVNAGYRRDKTTRSTTLAAAVKEFCTPGRVHYLGFDQDDDPKTKRRVAIAICVFAGLLKKEGQAGDVRIIEWSSKGGLRKGVDDLIAVEGIKAFENAIANAVSIETWQTRYRLLKQCTTPASLVLNVPDISTIDTSVIPTEGIVVLIAGKGQGKTKLIGKMVEGSEKIYAGGHRIALMRNLCDRIGVDYQGDLDRCSGRLINTGAYSLRFGGCVDSLLAVNPADLEGCDLIFDEFTQVLRHLLQSPTCNKDGKRSVLLAILTKIVRNARRVIVADADMNDESIAWLTAVRDRGEDPFIIRNDIEPESYPVRFIECKDSSEAIRRLFEDCKKLKEDWDGGDKYAFFVAVDSKALSKQLLLAMEGLTGLKGLVINSETSGDGDAMELCKCPDPLLARQEYAFVIASPSLGTGNSIEIQGWFKKVYGIFTGHSITDGDMAQALARVREPVERVVWVAPVGKGFGKVSSSADYKTVQKALLAVADFNAMRIRSGLTPEIAPLVDGMREADNPHVKLYCQQVADQNWSMWNLRGALRTRLENEGSILTIDVAAKDVDTKDVMQAAREECNIIEATSVATARNLTIDEAAALEIMGAISTEDGFAMRKWKLREFYKVEPEEITIDFVMRDRKGQFQAEISSLENMIETDLALDKSVDKIKAAGKWSQHVCPWDIPGIAGRKYVRDQLGLPEFLDPIKKWTKYDIKTIATKARACADQVRLVLHLTITDKMSDTQIAHTLLAQLGVKLKREWSRTVPGHEGEKLRVYSIEETRWIEMMEVIARKRRVRHKLETLDEIEEQNLSDCIEMFEAEKDDDQGVRAVFQAVLEVFKNIPKIENHFWVKVGQIYKQQFQVMTC